MTETTDKTPLQLAAVLWRRKRWVVPCLLVGLAGGLAAARWLPPKYQATTLILVDAQTVPKDYVKTTVTTSLRDRLRSIQEEITNRENLERIILEMDLYPEMRREQPMETVVAKIRRNLRVKVEPGRAFRISFTGDEPADLARTTNRLAELFIEENLRQREGQAKRTADFLENELEDMRRQLEEKEAEVASFRVRHEGELPEQRLVNLAAITNLDRKLDLNQQAFEQAEIRRLLLRREVSASPDGSITASNPRERLQQLRMQLVELRSRFTERHPDVARLKREIDELEAVGVGSEEVEEPPALMGLDPELAAELSAVDRQVEQLESEREELLAEITEIQARLDHTPRLEQEMLRLTRDYDNLERSYQDLLSKRIEARLAERLEKSQEGEQFRILARAIPPQRPYYPNKIYCLGVGLAAGALLGVGAAFLREVADQTYGNQRSLQEGLPGPGGSGPDPRAQ